MFPRPAPEHPDSFAHMAVLPELKGWTLRRCSLARRALRLWCRACGRDVVITPAGMASTFRKQRALTVEEFVAQAKCATCGANEAQASMWCGENPSDPRPMFVRREHAGVALRRDG